MLKLLLQYFASVYSLFTFLACANQHSKKKITFINRSKMTMKELQAVVFAVSLENVIHNHDPTDYTEFYDIFVLFQAGHGNRCNELVRNRVKCLMPVGPYPLIFYPLSLLQKHGFTGL